MFWHKKNKSKTYLNILYKNGLASQSFALGEIPIKEEMIIKKALISLMTQHLAIFIEGLWL